MIALNCGADKEKNEFFIRKCSFEGSFLFRLPFSHAYLLVVVSSTGSKVVSENAAHHINISHCCVAYRRDDLGNVVDRNCALSQMA